MRVKILTCLCLALCCLAALARDDDPFGNSRDDDPFSKKHEDPYAVARSQALAVMTDSKAPHNWCHCGSCETIATATEMALAAIDKADKADKADCTCEKGKCTCKPGNRQDSRPPEFKWHRAGNYPGRFYLYADGQLAGLWDVAGQYFRRYHLASDSWKEETGPSPYLPPAREIEQQPQVNPGFQTYQIYPGGCSGGSCGSRFFWR